MLAHIAHHSTFANPPRSWVMEENYGILIEVVEVGRIFIPTTSLPFTPREDLKFTILKEVELNDGYAEKIIHYIKALKQIREVQNTWFEHKVELFKDGGGTGHSHSFQGPLKTLKEPAKWKWRCASQCTAIPS